MSTQSHLQENNDNNNHQNDQAIIQHQIQEYVEEKKELYNILLLFLENSENDDQNFQKLNDFISSHQESTDREDFENFLQLITNISNNHCYESKLFSKNFQIIRHYQDKIKQTFSNIEIFNIFQDDKKILLFLFENKIITVDSNIYSELINKSDTDSYRYCHFFYPEIKEFIGEERSKAIFDDILSTNPDIFENFNQKRREGENDTYICNLIRKDSIKEFVSYVNQSNFPLESRIKPSIFETNSFLRKTSPTLIEYSAFFGSIQIFQYLRMNKIDLTPSLWLYAIHSCNEELIQILQSCQVDPPIDQIEKDDVIVENDGNHNYEKCFIEAIICHHNNFADYIRDNLMNESSDNVSQYVLKSRNYKYFQNDFSLRNDLYYLCCYNYNKLVDLLIKKDEKEIRKKINNKISYKISLQEAASNNQIEIVYYLLLSQKRIDDKCFQKIENFNKIAIPSTITSIGREAFNECSLEQVFIPSSVVEIGSGCFKDCSKLSSINIHAALTKIEKETFKSCSSLVQVIVPSTVKVIEEKAFYNCSKLTHIELPSSITSIGNWSFFQCSSLKQIQIPSSVTTIGSWTFTRCSSLKQVQIPSSVTTIGYSAFAGCSSLGQIEIPSSITSIEDCAFSECSSLQQITIPPSVTTIGNSTFSACSSLQQVLIPSIVTSIGNCSFYECTSLAKISIPSSVTKIGYCAFYGCTSLVDISLPSSLTDICAYAFYECTSLQNTSHSYLIKDEPFINIDNYEINKLIGNCYPSPIFEATNKETNQVVLLRAYNDLHNHQKFIQMIIVSSVSVPSIINVHSYRRPLTDPEREQTKTKSFTTNFEKKENTFDLTKYIVISDFMKNGNVADLTQQYFDKKNAIKEMMNPTIRSKIIYCVSTMVVVGQGLDQILARPLKKFRPRSYYILIKID